MRKDCTPPMASSEAVTTVTHIAKLDGFVRGALSALVGRRLWLFIMSGDTEVGQIYLRCHGDNRARRSQLDVASVIIDDAHQHRGHFKAVLGECLDKAREHRIHTVLIENVINPDLAAWLDRQPGWQKECSVHWDVPSYTYLNP